MASPILVTPPDVEPIGLDEVVDHLRLDGEASEDRRLRSFILSARHWAEEYLGYALITQTFDVRVDTFNELGRVPRPPLQSVTSIAYVDTDGNSQTVSSTVYVVDVDEQPGRIRLAFGESWPAHRAEPLAVTARIVAGYGDAPADVPETIRNAMLIRVGRFYEGREPMIIGATAHDTGADFALLEPYRLARF